MSLQAQDSKEDVLILLAFLYGIVIGSFINVVILRLPQKQSLIFPRSHCMDCGKRLRWYELIPIVSYCFLRGRCSACKAKISPRYPLVELLNGILFVLVYRKFGISLHGILYAAFASALLAGGWIDARTKRIPNAISIFVLLLGIGRILLQPAEVWFRLLGMLSVSLPLLLLYLITRGGAIGGGDIKLMAGAGLLLGPYLSLLAFALACIIGSVIHLFRMAVFHAGRELAFGPYLSIGCGIALFWGEQILYGLYGIPLTGTV